MANLVTHKLTHTELDAVRKWRKFAIDLHTYVYSELSFTMKHTFAWNVKLKINEPLTVSSGIQLK